MAIFSMTPIEAHASFIHAMQTGTMLCDKKEAVHTFGPAILELPVYTFTAEVGRELIGRALDFIDATDQNPRCCRDDDGYKWYNVGTAYMIYCAWMDLPVFSVVAEVEGEVSVVYVEYEPSTKTWYILDDLSAEKEAIVVRDAASNSAIICYLIHRDIPVEYVHPETNGVFARMNARNVRAGKPEVNIRTVSLDAARKIYINPNPAPAGSSGVTHRAHIVVEHIRRLSKPRRSDGRTWTTIKTHVRGNGTLTPVIIKVDP